MTTMPEYYARRAAEYERIYQKPERQTDLARLKRVIAGFFADAEVLELACGTGFWTEPAASAAKRVVGVDINEEVLDLARRKSYPRANAEFVCADLYAKPVLGVFDAALVAHWWSHVDRREQHLFLNALQPYLRSGARVLLLDNRYVEGSSTPVSRTDEFGNSYQQRGLDDGASFEVMKNFPDEAEMRAALAAFGREVSFVELQYYWYAIYEAA